MAGAEEEWLLTDGDIGIPRAMALFIRSKCSLSEKGDLVGIRAGADLGDCMRYRNNLH